MLSDYFDEYSLNARVRPALLALISPVLYLYLAFPQLYNLLAGAISIFVTFGLITTLAHFSRSRGKAVENKLFSIWGGKPSTIMLRNTDSHIDPITKQRYHVFLTKKIDGWVAPTKEDELVDLKKADQSYDSAVRWLLEYTRDQKKYSILFKENINYGFRRNCYGIKWFAVVITLIPIMLIAPNLIDHNFYTLNVGDLTKWISIYLSTLLFVWWTFVVRAEWVRDAANDYAIRLLSSCDNTFRI